MCVILDDVKRIYNKEDNNKKVMHGNLDDEKKEHL